MHIKTTLDTISLSLRYHPASPSLYSLQIFRAVEFLGSLIDAFIASYIGSGIMAQEFESDAFCFPNPLCHKCDTPSVPRSSIGSNHVASQFEDNGSLSRSSRGGTAGPQVLHWRASLTARNAFSWAMSANLAFLIFM
jgi:hypothetical protein